MTNITRNVPSAGRPGSADPLRQLLGLGAAGVVPVEQDAGGDHHRRHQQPTPRSAGTGTTRPRRTTRTGSPASRCTAACGRGRSRAWRRTRSRSARISADRLSSGCRQTKDSTGRRACRRRRMPDRREERRHVEGGVADHDERLDGRRQRHERPGLGPVPELRVVDRVRRPVHDRVLPDEQRRGEHHQQDRVAGVAPPADHDGRDQRDHHRRRCRSGAA